MHRHEELKSLDTARSESLRSMADETRDGEPLSINRAPADDLTPWIARLHATQVHIPESKTIACGTVSDTCFFRVLLKGRWHAELPSGPTYFGKESLFFGPNTKRLPVSVRGSFALAGVSLLPGACNALSGPKVGEHINTISSWDELVGPTDAIIERLDAASGPAEWIDILEDCMRDMIRQRGSAHPDPVTTAFDLAAFENPNLVVGDFAEAHNMSPRKLERVIKRDFGLSPKKVLRRARALDMAAQLRGVADEDEADELALRFFDQSHLNREFVQFFGMTPTQFVRTPQPLMTLALEMRQARRIELLDRKVKSSSILV